ncbi:PTS sugar transporter subunit IIA [Nitriliruptor alkaliphilus]|uniref:PTS sugar transporter subunit IIA n=1 Tax=Nitriliruptor alkaliphilus TaxID=427918 RepID=UPI0009F84BAF|nr:fructose PTS transporter subunit IIA [Nitriliruptor alkaliphilus]
MSTTITDLTGPQLVVDLEGATAEDPAAAIRALAGALAADGRVTDEATFVAAVLAREDETGGTGMGSGVAIPHAKSSAVARAAVAIGRASSGIDFGSEDGAPADLVFLIAAPEGADDLHVRVLSRLARRLIHESFRSAVRDATSPGAVITILEREVEL